MIIIALELLALATLVWPVIAIALYLTSRHARRVQRDKANRIGLVSPIQRQPNPRRRPKARP